MDILHGEPLVEAKRLVASAVVTKTPLRDGRILVEQKNGYLNREKMFFWCNKCKTYSVDSICFAQIGRKTIYSMECTNCHTTIKSEVSMKEAYEEWKKNNPRKSLVFPK